MVAIDSISKVRVMHRLGATDRFSKDYRLTVFAGFLRVQIILQFYQTKQHRYLRLNDPLPIFSLLLL